MKKLLLLLTLVLSFHMASAITSLTQGNWRWRNDNGAENSTTNWKAAQNTPISLTGVSDKFRLRLECTTNGDGSSTYYTIQCQTSNGSWESIPTSAAGNMSPFVVVSISDGLTNNQTTTAQLNTYFDNTQFPFSGGRTFVGENSGTLANTAAGRYEFEIVIEPTTYMDASKDYTFRIASGPFANSATSDPSLVSPAVTYARVVAREIYNYNSATATATLSAEATLTNGADITERGFVYSTINPAPTLIDNNAKIVAGNGLGIYESQLTGIAANQNYYVRPYVTNSVGTSYGVTKAIGGGFPSVSSAAPTSIKDNSVVLGGTLTSEGGSVSGRGILYSRVASDVSFTSPTGYSPVDMGTGVGSFSETVDNLDANTLYYARAYAQNSSGNSYGEVFSFTTRPLVLTDITSTAGPTGSTTNANPIPIRVEFTESVSNFSDLDVFVGNGTLSDFSGSGTTYTFNVTPSAEGKVVVQVPFGAGETAEGINSRYASFEMNYVTVLPVDLFDFTTKAENNSAKLQWITVSETDNDHFVIERAVNDTGFKKLATVAGKGTTANTSTYTWVDQSPLNGKNYYRLKQVDKNGKSKELGDRVVSFDLADINSQVYPNPAISFTNVSLAVGVYQKLELSDLNGKVLLTQAIAKSASYVNLNLAVFPKGIYLIKLSGNVKQEVLKLIKQ